MSNILIRGGKIIDGSKESEVDIVVSDGKIAGIERPGSVEKLNDWQEMDAKGLWVLPGLIDVHVHLREPGQEWKETIADGARAALKGGYTTVCTMPNTLPVNDHEEVTKYILEKARSAGPVHVRPIGAVSKGLKGKDLSPLAELRDAGCIAFSDDGEPIYNSGIMRRALEWCKELDVPLCAHEEDKCLSCGGSMNESPLSLELGLRGMPGVAEDVMVARDIELARFTGAHVHFCHVSTARSVELIRRAKNDGIRVSAEVTPHHLALTEESVRGYNTAAKMSPPLRTEEERDALREGLRDGTIDMIASDHAPHEADSKRVEFAAAAMGIIGLQTSLSIALELVHEGLLPLSRLPEVLSGAPAEIFKLPGGKIQVGAGADLILIHPDREWVFSEKANLSKSFNTPFVDKTFRGGVQHVLIQGQSITVPE